MVHDAAVALPAELGVELAGLIVIAEVPQRRMRHRFLDEAKPAPVIEDRFHLANRERVLDDFAPRRRGGWCSTVRIVDQPQDVLPLRLRIEVSTSR